MGMFKRGDDGECLDCGELLLREGHVYYDGQEIVCPACQLQHWVCCDTETAVHLHTHDEGD